MPDKHEVGGSSPLEPTKANEVREAKETRETPSASTKRISEKSGA